MTTKQKYSTAEQANAERLWANLAEAWQVTEKAIVAVIEAKAWLPLGYSTFAEAYQDKIGSRISLAAEVRGPIVYQLLSEGLEDVEIASAVKGVSPDGVANIRRQKDNGVPATAVDGKPVAVDRYRRNKPDLSTRYVSFGIDADTYAELSAEALEQGTTLAEIAREAMIAELAKRKRARLRALKTQRVGV